MTGGNRKNSSPDLRKIASNNSQIIRAKNQVKSGGVSFLGLNVGGAKHKSSTVPRGIIWRRTTSFIKVDPSLTLNYFNDDISI